MEIIDKHLHEKCFHFDKSELPLVELITAPKGKNSNLPIRTNEIVFFLEGELASYSVTYRNTWGERGIWYFFRPEGAIISKHLRIQSCLF